MPAGNTISPLYCLPFVLTLAVTLVLLFESRQRGRSAIENHHTALTMLSSPVHPERKASKNPSSRCGQVWSSREEILLLAWLDHSIKHRDVDFKSTVLEKLEHPRTIKSVNQKLNRIWILKGSQLQDEGKPGTAKDDGFYDRFGSRCLLGLSHIEKSAIQIAFQTFEDEYLRTKNVTRSASHSRRTSVADQTSSMENEIFEDVLIENELIVGEMAEGGVMETPNLKSISDRLKEQRIVEDKIIRDMMEVRVIEDKFWEDMAVETKTAVPNHATYNRLGMFEEVSRTIARQKPQSLPTIFPNQPLVYNKRKHTIYAQSQPMDPGHNELITSTQDQAKRVKSNSYQTLFDHGSRDDHLLIDVFGKGLKERDHHLQSSDTSSRLNGRNTRVSLEKEVEEKSDILFSQSRAIKYLQDDLLQKNSALDDSEKKIKDLESKLLRTLNDLNSTNNEIKGLKDKLCQHENDYADDRDEIEDLKEKLLQKDDDLEYISKALSAEEKRVSIFKMAARDRDSQLLWPIEAVTAAYLQRINDLNSELNERNSLSKFTNLTFKSHERFAAVPIEILFRDIFDNARTSILSFEHRRLPNPTAYQKSESLNSLACKLLGVCKESQIQEETVNMIRKFEQIKPQALLRGLVTAAFQQWVFETDFPAFGNERLLRMYRSVVHKQAGALALRNLDMASLQRSIASPSFLTRTIPERAKQLAAQLSQTLAPLFNKNSLEGSPKSSSFATWGEDKMSREQMRDYLQRAFGEALLTKANTCLNIEDYEFVIYPPGTIFDSNTMVVETAEGVPYQSKLREVDFSGRSVGICTQAALFTYPRKPRTQDMTVAESVIPVRNFVEKTEEERKGVIPLVKAVVVLDED